MWAFHWKASTLYNEISFKDLGFLDETPLIDFTGHKQENTFEISGPDSARNFLGTLPFCKARGSPAGGFNNV